MFLGFIIFFLCVFTLLKGGVHPLANAGLSFAVISLACLRLLIKRTSGERKILLPERLGYAAAAGVLLVAFLRGAYLYDAFLEFCRLTACLLLYWLAREEFLDARAAGRFLFLSCVFGGLTAFAGLLQYVRVIPCYWWDAPSFMSGPYVNHNHFAGLMEMLLPASAAFAATQKGGTRIISFAGCILMACALAFSMSRGAWLSLAAAVFVLCFFIDIPSKRTRMFLLASAGAVCLAAAAAVSLLPQSAISKRLVVFEKISALPQIQADRRLMWSQGLKMIKDNPSGIGLGQLVHEFPRYRTKEMMYKVDYLHNDYIHFTAETGMVFLPVFAWFLAVLFRAAARVRFIAVRASMIMAVGTLCSVLAMLFHSLFDFNLHIPANACWFACMAGAFFSLQPGEQVIDERKARLVCPTA